MTLTNTQKTRYTNPALAKSSVRIGVRFNTSDISTLKNHCVFFVDNISRLSQSYCAFMMGCIGVSKDTPFLVYGTPIQCNSSPNRLASFGDDYLNHLHKGIIMSNVSIFNFENQSITTATSNDGEIFFHASELATALGFGNPRQAIANHVDKEDVLKLDALTQGGKQKVNFVNESGMYALIFGSTKPEAKRFKKWVTSEVLPTIRKTGKYQAPTPSKEYLSNQDWDNLKRLVWLCEKEFFCKNSASYAIWARLREVTGVKSPEKFEVQHLPILAQEFQRLLSAIEQFGNAKRQAEATFIKHILRYADDEMLSHLIEDVANQEFHQQLQQQLPTVFNRDCLALMNRH